MDKIVYVCTGSCNAKISEEQYKAGLTKCGAADCTLFRHAFEKRLKCDVCSRLYKEAEDHSHTTE